MTEIKAAYTTTSKKMKTALTISAGIIHPAEIVHLAEDIQPESDQVDREKSVNERIENGPERTSPVAFRIKRDVSDIDHSPLASEVFQDNLLQPCVST